jgi:hypothetical protein
MEQWVNVPKEDRWVTGPITDLKRAGFIQVWFQLQSEGRGILKYRLVDLDGNAVYTDTERARNLIKFGGQATKGTRAIEGTDKELMDIHLPVAGGNQYKVEMQFTDAVTGEVRTTYTPDFGTRRILFYQSIAMTGVTAPDTSPVVDTFWDASKKYYIKLVEENAGEEIPFVAVLDSTNKTQWGAFRKEVESKDKTGSRGTLGFPIIWVENLATKEEKKVSQFVAAGSPSKLGSWDEATGVVLCDVGAYLWYGFHPDDDARKAWLNKYAVWVFFNDNSKRQIMDDDARPDLVTIHGAPDFAEGGHHWVKIDLASFALKDVKKIGVTISVNVVSGYKGGFTSSFGYIVMATKSAFKDRTVEEVQRTLIHEIGHQIGMVPDGEDLRLDKHAHFYTEQGHQGRHCGNGASYSGGAWSGNPTCVMYGSSTAATSAFCPECEKAVRKVDLSPPVVPPLENT